MGCGPVWRPPSPAPPPVLKVRGRSACSPLPVIIIISSDPFSPSAGRLYLGHAAGAARFLPRVLLPAGETLTGEADRTR